MRKTLLKREDYKIIEKRNQVESTTTITRKKYHEEEIQILSDKKESNSDQQEWLKMFLQWLGIISKDPELDLLIDEKIKESVTVKYKVPIRIFMIIVCCASLIICVSAPKTSEDEEGFSQVAQYGMYWIPFFIVVTVVMDYYPKILIYAKPPAILMVFISTADITFHDDAYPFHRILLFIMIR